MKQLIKGIARPLLWFAAWMMAGIIVFRLLRPFLGGWTELAAELGVQLPIALLMFWHLNRKHKTPKTVLTKKASISIVLVFVLLCCVPTQLFCYAAGTASPLGGSNIQTTIIRSLLLAPVMEEFMFRGVLFRMAHQRLRFWPAAIFNAVMFQLVHGIDRLPVTVPLALASAALYDATGNIRYSMMLHFACNWLAVFMYDIHIPVVIALPMYLIGQACVILGCIKREAILKPSLVKSRG